MPEEVDNALMQDLARRNRYLESLIYLEILRLKSCDFHHQKLLRSGLTHEGVEFDGEHYWVVTGWCSPGSFHESSRAKMSAENFFQFPQFLPENLRGYLRDALWEKELELQKEKLLEAALSGVH